MTKVTLRIIFILVCAGIGYHFYLPATDGFNWYGLTLGLSASLVIVALEIGFSRRFLSFVPVIMLGLIFGFILAHLVLNALFLLPFFDNHQDELAALERQSDGARKDLARLHPDQAQQRKALENEIKKHHRKETRLLESSARVEQWKQVIELSTTFVFVYLSILVILHTKDDFKFIIPYVEFARQSKGNRSMILDTSVIIDGRIADICDTRIVDSVLVIPRFVLDELQRIADSADRVKRKRGRRGLDILNRLRTSKTVETRINDTAFPGVKEVDAKLIQLAVKIDAKLVTNDFNLNKVARLQSVDVVNINELANALRPVVLPGEEMRVELIREGEEAGQGVGYLDDGTMVVVDRGKDSIGQTVTATITSVLQTSAGKMIFGKLKKA